MHRRSLILAGAAAALALTWYALDGRAARRTSERQIAQLQSELEELRARFRDPPAGAPGRDLAASRELASLARDEARAETQRALGELTDTGGAASAKPPPVSLEQSQASVLEAFGQERRDPQWSEDAARKLEATIRDHLPEGSRLGTIECHTTMCQIEVLHADARVAQDLLMNGFGDWPGSLFVAKDREDRGEQAVTIIAAREGHEPPLAPR